MTNTDKKTSPAVVCRVPIMLTVQPDQETINRALNKHHDWKPGHGEPMQALKQACTRALAVQAFKACVVVFSDGSMKLELIDSV